MNGYALQKKLFRERINIFPFSSARDLFSKKSFPFSKNLFPFDIPHAAVKKKPSSTNTSYSLCTPMLINALRCTSGKGRMAESVQNSEGQRERRRWRMYSLALCRGHRRRGKQRKKEDAASAASSLFSHICSDVGVRSSRRDEVCPLPSSAICTTGGRCGRCRRHGCGAR